MRSRRARPRLLHGADCCNDVSTHAPVKSATIQSGGKFGEDFGFNPRAREERDDPRWRLKFGSHSFNPRAREERDRTRVRRLSLHVPFQPTRP